MSRSSHRQIPFRVNHIRICHRTLLIPPSLSTLKSCKDRGFSFDHASHVQSLVLDR